jgi:hypothetical protein
MNTSLLLMTFLASVSFSSLAQTQLKVTLDTKQMLNPDCNLNGGVVADDKVYIHAGLCTSNEIFCMQAITPYESEVWEHVVGYWGAQATDDSIGIMTYDGNGIWSWEIDIESYFSDPGLVDQDSSTLMPSGATPYTMGVVFRDKDGAYSGRDDGCNDLFITHLTTTPVVIQSTDLSDYSAITVEKTTGIKKIDNPIVDVTTCPNPFDEKTTFSYFLKNSQKIEIVIYNSLGQKVTSIINERQLKGKHSIEWNSTETEAGVYYYSIKDENGQLNYGTLIKK